MEYKEDEFLQISGLQHFSFCQRQWALIHIEQLWRENLKTVEGEIMHTRAHDASLREQRGEMIITRDMRVFSSELGVSGACDIVEFHRSDKGISLNGQEGKYIPYPIEYKRGAPREDHANELQLCAQAMCLEEMLCCDIHEGALYFGEIRRRVQVECTQDLRNEVKTLLKEMHKLYKRQYTPKVRPKKSCQSCSLKDICLANLQKKQSVHTYLYKHLED